MALTVLNNISSLTAENALANTQASLQKTLTQLSTGLKINSGSDDAAGLSIVSGMNANISALTQSQQNASNGIGMLQTADGALSQVTTLLNRAVTLATEGSTSGITASQSTALDTEFQSILSEINQIGQATNFNGSNVFGSAAPTTFAGVTGINSTTATTAGTITITDTTTGNSLTLTHGADAAPTDATVAGQYTGTAGTAAGVNAAIAAAFGGNITGSITTGGAEQITATTGDNFTVASADTGVVGATSGVNGATVAGTSYTANGTITGASLIATAALTAGSVTTITDTATGKSLVVTQGAADDAATEAGTTGNYTATAKTVSGLNNAIAAAFGTKVVGTLVSGTSETITGTDKFTVNSNDLAVLGQTQGTATSVTGTAANNENNVYLGDGTSTGASNTLITTSISALSATALSLSKNDLLNATDAIAALSNISTAINTVSAQRGVIGASVNRLTAAAGDISSEVTNLQSAANSIQNADIGKTVANMTQYNVLQSTGMAALQQSNQAQQAVLKLVQ
ncbi:MAG: flagellin [Terracidiphilus sp.]|jgi:flagellin